MTKVALPLASIIAAMLLLSCSPVKPVSSDALSAANNVPAKRYVLSSGIVVPEPFSPGMEHRSFDFTKVTTKVEVDKRPVPGPIRKARQRNLLWDPESYYYGSMIGWWNQEDTSTNPAAGIFARYVVRPNLRPATNVVLYAPSMIAPRQSGWEITQYYGSTDGAWLGFKNWADNTGYRVGGGSVPPASWIWMKQNQAWLDTYCFKDTSTNPVTYYYYVQTYRMEGTGKWWAVIYNPTRQNSQGGYGVWEDIGYVSGPTTNKLPMWGWNYYEAFYGCVNLGSSNKIFSDSIQVYGKNPATQATGWKAVTGVCNENSSPKYYGYGTAAHKYENNMSCTNTINSSRSTYDHWWIY